MKRTGKGQGAGAPELPQGGAGHGDHRSGFQQQGSGFARARHADRRPSIERDLTGGRADAGEVEVRFVDPITGEVWTAREYPRLYLPVSEDWDDQTLDLVRGQDGEAHWVLLDGPVHPLDVGTEQYSPDVGRTPGTAHLPAEQLPILPGKRFGPDRAFADVTFLCPDTTFKRTSTDDVGAYQRRQVLEFDPEQAAKKRGLKNGDVKDLEVEQPGITGKAPQAIIQGPGIVPQFPFLHERLSLNAAGNQLLKASQVASPFGGTLDTATVREYLKLGGGAGISLSGFPFCTLVPMGVSGGRADLNGYSYQVGIALLAEYVDRATGAIGEMAENILRNHNYVSSVAGVLRDAICCLIENLSPDDDDAKTCLRELSKEFPKTLCKQPCKQPTEPVITPDDDEPVETGSPTLGGSGGGGSGGGGSGGGGSGGTAPQPPPPATGPSPLPPIPQVLPSAPRPVYVPPTGAGSSTGAGTLPRPVHVGRPSVSIPTPSPFSGGGGSGGGAGGSGSGSGSGSVIKPRGP